jgi:hypothetical protein
MGAFKKGKVIGENEIGRLCTYKVGTVRFRAFLSRPVQV